METKTQRQWLEESLARALEKYGPDSASAKHLKAQIASLGTVRHPSQLVALNSDSYHGGVLRKEALDKMSDAAQTETISEAYERQGTELAKKDQ